ncbi:MAG: hypothetical protein H7Y06_09780, partial [Opitutaceae bacterium]|nr:hypothetical protein [Opitutaceae bacterium]
MRGFLFPITFVCVLAASACAAVESRLSFDFNAANPWKDATTLASSPAIISQVEWKFIGTIDEAGTSTATGALLLTVNSEKAPTAWGAAAVSGPLRVATRETDLRKLTLGFMLSSSSALPVLIRIESCNTQGLVNGTLQGVIYPAAADFYQRYSLDLSTLTQIG